MLCEPPELLIELPRDELELMLLVEPPMLRLDPTDWLLELFPLADEPIELRDSLLVLLRCTLSALELLDTFSRVPLETFSRALLDTFSRMLLDDLSLIPLVA